MAISGIGGGFALPALFGGSAADSAERLQKTPQEEFLEYARQSPAERIRAAILEEMGLTEEELESMPPETRTALEKQIAERIKEKAEAASEKQTGLLVDRQA